MYTYIYVFNTDHFNTFVLCPVFWAKLEALGAHLLAAFLLKTIALTRRQLGARRGASSEKNPALRGEFSGSKRNHQ